MKWVKRGLVIQPDTRLDWMKSHAAVPCAEHVSGDVFRVYFCSRDAQNRSQAAYAELDLKRSEKILFMTKKPVLGLGSLGAFDDNGVTPTWVVNRGREKFLYYVGWNKGATVRMLLFTGLAISRDGGKSFKRFSEAPILERQANDAFLTATLSVLREGKRWRMWYVSGDGWTKKGNETFPRYNIKYAESSDGICWQRDGAVCVNYKSGEEYALARPCVLKDGKVYKMWYAYKSKDYRIGYAESKDGLRWTRKDAQAGIDVSKSGWDSKMVEYPFVFEHKGKKHMFYNGNDYGKEGIGYAVLE